MNRRNILGAALASILYYRHARALIPLGGAGAGIVQVNTPTITPNGGSFGTAQTVSLTSANATAIYYTTDGTTPTTASTHYTGTFTVSSTETVKALGVAPGLVNSFIASASFTITLQVDTPTIAPNGGTYSSPQSVSLTSANATAIYYTVDGSTPTAYITEPALTGVSGNFFVHGNTGFNPGDGGTLGNPPAGQFGMVAEQTHTFVATSWAASGKTGFAPTSPSTTQAGYAATGQTSAIQIQGNTVGAFTQAADWGGSASAPYAGAGKFMMSPGVYGLTGTPYSGSSGSVSSTMQLQVPTAVAGPENPYANLDLRFNNGSTYFSLNIGHFALSGATAVTASQDGDTGDYLCVVPMVSANAPEYLTINGAQMQSSPFTGYQTFAFSVSYAQMAAALAFMAANGYGSVFTGALLEPSAWTLVEAHLNAEFPLSSNTYPTTDTTQLGYSMSDWVLTAGTTTLYAGPFTVSSSETVQALGTAPGLANSVVASAVFTISSGGAISAYANGVFSGAWANGQDLSYGAPPGDPSVNWLYTTNPESGQTYSAKPLGLYYGLQYATNWPPAYQSIVPGTPGTNGFDLSGATWCEMDIYMPTRTTIGLSSHYMRGDVNVGADIGISTGINVASFWNGEPTLGEWVTVKYPLVWIGCWLMGNHYKISTQPDAVNCQFTNIKYLTGNSLPVYRGNTTLESGWTDASSGGSMNYNYGIFGATGTYALNQPPTKASAFYGTISGNTLTVNTASTAGPIAVGQGVYYNGIGSFPGPQIATQTSGTTFTITGSQGNVTSVQMFSVVDQRNMKAAQFTGSGTGFTWKAEYSAGLSLSPYSYFTFAAMPTKKANSWSVQMLGAGGTPIGSAVNAAAYTPQDNGVGTTTFTVYVIPLSEFALSSETIYGYQITDTAGQSANVVNFGQVGFFS